VIKIRYKSEEIIVRVFPKLKDRLRIAQMDTHISIFVMKCLILSFVMSICLTVIGSFILLSHKLYFFIPLLFISLLYALFLALVRFIPMANTARVKKDIESDIFIPSRMLLTLLEAGNSLISAIESVSYTRAKSSKYFGKIASEIYLGKSVEQAIDDAIKYTPSDSFRMVMQPIKKSLKTGTDVQKTLLATLQELQEQKIVEIEQYEKKLNLLSMVYMIFGTILPAIGIVALVVVLAIMGIKVEFFPILFILLVLILLLQLFFVNIFKNTRPLVKL
jgi:pilus assembly protein TadC